MALGAWPLLHCSEERTFHEPSAGAGQGGGGDEGQGSGGDGSGSDAGATGEAGGTGEAPTTCTSDSDCSDDPCAPEACDQGICQGAPVCENPDADHCEATCTVVDGAPQCGLTGRDADDDEHRDSRCEQDADADDCNDAQPLAYDGATEACDGVDNDCNGEGELQEELFDISGTTENIDADTGVDWSTETRTFGVVAARSGELVFEQWDAAGELVEGSEKVIAESESSFSHPFLSWNDGAYGLVYSEYVQAETGYHLYFVRLDADGTKLDDALPLTGLSTHSETARDLQPLAAGGWALAFSRLVDSFGERDFIRRFSANGSKVGGEIGLGTKDAPGTRSTLSVLGDRLAASWTWKNESAEYRSDWSPLDAELSSLSDPRPVVENGYETNAAVQVTPSGYVLAWQGATENPGEWALKFEQRDSEGNVVCGPIALDTWERQAAYIAPPRILRFPEGYAVISGADAFNGASSTQYTLRAFVVNDGCEDPGVSFDLGAGESARRPHVAVGESSIAIIWHDYMQYKRRIVGRYLCE